MIKKEKLTANELRLGNIITAANESNEPILTVIGITDEMIETLDSGLNSHKVLSELALPIKLNKSLFSLCGFKPNDDNRLTLNSFGYIFVPSHDFKQIDVYDGSGTFLVFNCEYVHQLQNLYSITTGGKLQIQFINC